MNITPVGADTYVGELDDKNTGPNNWRRNKFTWHLLQKWAVWNKYSWISHTLGAAVFLLDRWTKQSVKNEALLSMSFGKCLLNFTFLVSTNASWFHSYLRTPSGYHMTDKSCFNSHCQKNFFSKNWDNNCFNSNCHFPLLITLLFRGIISEKSLVLWNFISKALIRARFSQSWILLVSVLQTATKDQIYCMY